MSDQGGGLTVIIIITLLASQKESRLRVIFGLQRAPPVDLSQLPSPDVNASHHHHH